MKKENKWLGLILPIITFLFALISVFDYFDNPKGVDYLFSLLAVFFLQNVPTLILLAIYLGTRAKKKKTSQLNKMKIKDL